MINYILKKFGQDGDRTHAVFEPFDLKSNSLTTRTPGLIKILIKQLFNNN